MNTLKKDNYWVNGEWIQPPVPIKHGELVEVKADNYPPMLGRYIGKGYGIVELYNYATGTTYVKGKVITRGINRNPHLVSDEILLEFIED